MTNEDSAEPLIKATKPLIATGSEVVEKASGRGKPGDKPEIPRGAPKDKSIENSSSDSKS